MNKVVQQRLQPEQRRNLEFLVSWSRCLRARVRRGKSRPVGYRGGGSGPHWQANFSGANRCGADLGEAQVLEANRGLFVLAVPFVVSGLP
jgi:hypothetical protein